MIKHGRGKSAFLVIVMILTILLVRFPSPIQGAQFVIAGWSFPDEYGQGVYIVTPYQNSSGSFVTIPNPETGIGTCYWNNATTYNLNFTANTALRFDARVLLNYTRLGLSHPADNVTGRNYLRVNLEMFLASESVFSLQNMTYDSLWGLYETGLWWYAYVDIVDFILVAGQIYTVVITLEVLSSAWFNDTWDYADTETGDDTSSGSLSDTYSSNNIDLSYTKSGTSTSYIELTFYYPSNFVVSKFNYTFEVSTGVNDDDAEIELYDWVGVGYDDLHTGIENPADVVYTGQITDPKYFDSVSGVKFKLWSQEGDSGASGVYVDQLIITWYLSDWQEVGVAEFIFPVGWNPVAQFGYDSFFIFLGLIMIVASTMYLVRGGKDEMSSDKFFYFVILFIMGWALFVGGIMP